MITHTTLGLSFMAGGHYRGEPRRFNSSPRRSPKRLWRSTWQSWGRGHSNSQPLATVAAADVIVRVYALVELLAVTNVVYQPFEAVNDELEEITRR